jgi:hypothetical protein
MAASPLVGQWHIIKEPECSCISEYGYVFFGVLQDEGQRLRFIFITVRGRHLSGIDTSVGLKFIFYRSLMGAGYLQGS